MWLLIPLLVGLAGWYRLSLRASYGLLLTGLLFWAGWSGSYGWALLWLSLWTALFLVLSLPPLRQEWLMRPALRRWGWRFPVAESTPLSADLATGTPNWWREAPAEARWQAQQVPLLSDDLQAWIERQAPDFELDLRLKALEALQTEGEDLSAADVRALRLCLLRVADQGQSPCPTLPDLPAESRPEAVPTNAHPARALLQFDQQCQQSFGDGWCLLARLPVLATPLRYLLPAPYQHKRHYQNLDRWVAWLALLRLALPRAAMQPAWGYLRMLAALLRQCPDEPLFSARYQWLCHRLVIELLELFHRLPWSLRWLRPLVGSLPPDYRPL
jgi:hypothetical protein